MESHRHKSGSSDSVKAAWPGGPASPPSGYGASDGETVEVMIGGDGLVEAVTIDPRALKQDVSALADSVRHAVREAQEDWFAQLAEHDGGPAAEGRLRKRLDEIDEEYSRRMEEIQRLIS